MKIFKCSILDLPPEVRTDLSFCLQFYAYDLEMAGFALNKRISVHQRVETLELVFQQREENDENS